MSTYSNTHPYRLGHYLGDYGPFGFIPWLLGEITGRNKQNEANNTVTAGQLESQAHDFEMADYQQELHQYNLLNDPSLQMQGYTNAGISRNAAAQAILGSQSSFSPAGSSVGSGASQMSSNVLPALLQSLIQAPVAQAEAANLNADTAGKDIDNQFKPVMNQATLDEIYGQLDNRARELGLHEEEVNIQRLLASSTIGLNAAQIAEKQALVEQIGEQCRKLAAETNLLKTYNRHEIIKMSLTNSEIRKTDAQTANIEQNTEYQAAQTANVEQDTSLKAAQTTGQEISNDQQRIELSLSDYRYQCSRLLGLPLGDDRVSTFMMSCITGNAALYVEALQRCETGYAGLIGRGPGLIFNSRERRSSKTRRREKYINWINDTPSMHPTWNN